MDRLTVEPRPAAAEQINEDLIEWTGPMGSPGFPGNFAAAIGEVTKVRPGRSSAADQVSSLGSIRTNVGFLTRGG
jgi:hypothetical protein